MEQTILTAVSAVGFPIVVTFYLLTRFQNSMDRFTEQLGELGPGEVGFITAGIKAVADCAVGDTITEEKRPAAAPLAGLLKVSGFLAAKSRNSRLRVLHVNTLEFLEGNQNGSFLQEEG